MINNSKITMEFKDEPLPTVFKRLEKESGFKILFTYNDVNEYKASGSLKDASITDALKTIIGRSEERRVGKEC